MFKNFIALHNIFKSKVLFHVMKKRHIFSGVFAVMLILILLFVFGFFQLNKVYNLTEKFGLTGNVVDYGTYDDEKKVIEEFTKTYAENFKNGKKTYLVLGNQKEAKIVSYDEIYYGKVNLVLKNKNQNVNIQESKYSLTKIIPKNNKVEILINGKSYEFDLKKDENVYFIVSEDINN